MEQHSYNFVIFLPTIHVFVKIRTKICFWLQRFDCNEHDLIASSLQLENFLRAQVIRFVNIKTVSDASCSVFGIIFQFFRDLPILAKSVNKRAY